VTDAWQQIVTLRWTINTVASMDVTIADNTDAAAYFNNYHNNPKGDVTDWDVSNEDLAVTALSMAFSQTGWYLISLAVVPADCSVSALFPTAINETAFHWNTTTGNYDVVSAIDPGKGYWIAIPEATTNTVSGLALQTYTEHFDAQGWYMIGSVIDSTDFTDPNDTPNGSVLLPAYSYDTDLNDYVATDSLFPSAGYWIAVLQECDLTVGEGALLAATKPVSQTDTEGFFDKFGLQPPPPPAINWQKEEIAEIPQHYALRQNYPNPCNPTTMIEFDVPEDRHVEIAIFNLRGEVISELINRDMSAGSYKMLWNGRDHSGKSVSSGLYFYRMTAGDFTATKKLIFVH